MGAPYPLPTNVTGFDNVFQYANTVTNDTFGIIMVLTIVVIAFITMKNQSTKYAFMGASAFGIVAAGVFHLIDIVSGTFLLFFVVSVVTVYFMIWFGGDN